jgi:hypothetical protein
MQSSQNGVNFRCISTLITLPISHFSDAVTWWPHQRTKTCLKTWTQKTELEFTRNKWLHHSMRSGIVTHTSRLFAEVNFWLYWTIPFNWYVPPPPPPPIERFGYPIQEGGSILRGLWRDPSKGGVPKLNGMPHLLIRFCTVLKRFPAIICVNCLCV